MVKEMGEDKKFRENSSRKTVVEVKHVAKTFRLPKEHSSELKQAFINRIRGIKGYTDLNVLRDITFDVKKGDFFGIVGRNGSGKSTLLKLLAGIYEPTKGTIETKGKIVPFIELGVGFNPELTGRENVYMNGAMLGFSNEEVGEMYDEIVDFAELEKFMDQKLKNYSSGMQVRLAFSIAIKAQGDILILDEVLAVGDEAFQRKCADFFDQIKQDKSKTVILVTHDMSAVKKYCNRAILIKDGEIIVKGSPEDAANEYSMENLDTTSPIDDEKNEKTDVKSPIKNFKAELLSPKQLNPKTDEVKIKVSYENDEQIETYIGINGQDMNRNVSVFTSDSKPLSSEQKISRTFGIKISEINNTDIKLLLTIRNADDSIIFAQKEDAAPKFRVVREDYKDPTKPTVYAMLFSRGKWEK